MDTSLFIKNHRINFLDIKFSCIQIDFYANQFFLISLFCIRLIVIEELINLTLNRVVLNFFEGILLNFLGYVGNFYLTPKNSINLRIFCQM